MTNFFKSAETAVEDAIGIPAGSSVSAVIDNIMSGIENTFFGIILATLVIFMPQLVKLTVEDLLVLGNNFRAFLVAVGGGIAWGTALTDMLNADWRETTDDAKMIGTDFAEAVATALEKYGVLPQGK